MFLNTRSLCGHVRLYEQAFVRFIIRFLDSICLSFGCLFFCLFDRTTYYIRSFGRSIALSIARSFERLNMHPFERTFFRSVAPVIDTVTLFYWC